MNRSDLFVLDASVLLKWVLGGEEEANTFAALRIREQWLDQKVEIILPSLWVFEVGNILGLKRTDQAAEILLSFLKYQIPEAKIEGDLCKLAFRLMKRHRVTFYDAIYHALAIQRKGIFITADRRYFNKTKENGHIQILSQYR